MVLNFQNRFGFFASFLDRPMIWLSQIYGRNCHVDLCVVHTSLEDRRFQLGFVCAQSSHFRNVFVESCSCTFNSSKGWHIRIYLTWSSINRHFQLLSYGWKFQVDGKNDRRDFTVLLRRCENSAKILSSLCNFFMPKAIGSTKTVLATASSWPGCGPSRAKVKGHTTSHDLTLTGSVLEGKSPYISEIQEPVKCYSSWPDTCIQ